MGIARRWVFPIIRLVIFAAIAAALVKLAFFADPVAEAGPAVPTGQIVEPTVAVATGTIRNDVVLEGTVAADPASPVKATAPGVVTKVTGQAGAGVDAETVLFTVKETVPREDGTTWDRYVQVKAGAAGTLSAFAVLVGQQIAVGDTVGQVAPPTFSVTASLLPEQQYRLLNQPTEAQVQVTGGPAPFTCTGLSITTPLAGAGDAGVGAGGDDGSAGGGSGGSSTTVRCAVPGDVTVFAGLGAELTIAGGVAENVLVVPLTAVEGAAGSGLVYVPAADGGDPETREVTLGITDGELVQVTGGLEEGDEILQFVPGAAADDGTCDPMMGC